MTNAARVPARLVIGLAVAIALDTALQLVWKTGIAAIPDTSSTWETLVAIALNPIFILVVVFMAAQLVNWLKVLDHADLSYAKPFTSLSYVTVCILSVLLLGEHIAPLQIVGIVVVVAGVWCVSRTSRATLAHVPAKWDPVRRQEHAPIDDAEVEPE
jgi:drug/metabolite transporter (DMT)-like permease